VKHKIGIIGYGFCGIAVETGLQEVAEVRIYDKFKDSESFYDVINNSDVLFVTVPTPMERDGWCNTSIVEEVCVNIDKNAEERKSIVIKSTVPPGTSQMISEMLDHRHGIVFNPEFLTEKHFIDDFLNQDRILIGSTTGCEDSDLAKVLNLYEDFIKTQKNPAFLGEMSCSEAAEMLKYTANCFLATKVTFFNEIFDVCKGLNIDFEEVKEATLWDKRIGKSHANVPGHDGLRGFGGACFWKDMNALVSLCQNEEIDVMLLESVITKNLAIREERDWEKLAQVTGKYEKK